MKIDYLSRRDFKTFISESPRDNMAFISINDTEGHFLEMDDLFQQMGYVSGHDYSAHVFSDVDGDVGGITDIQARLILEFVKRNENRHFVVHCLMGVSRSAAIAKFINDYLERDNAHLRSYDLYNKRVYRKLMAAAGDSFEAYKAHLRDLEESDRFSPRRARECELHIDGKKANVVVNRHNFKLK